MNGSEPDLLRSKSGSKIKATHRSLLRAWLQSASRRLIPVKLTFNQFYDNIKATMRNIETRSSARKTAALVGASMFLLGGNANAANTLTTQNKEMRASANRVGAKVLAVFRDTDKKQNGTTNVFKYGNERRIVVKKQVPGLNESKATAEYYLTATMKRSPSTGKLLPHTTRNAGVSIGYSPNTTNDESENVPYSYSISNSDGMPGPKSWSASGLYSSQKGEQSSVDTATFTRNTSFDLSIVKALEADALSVIKDASNQKPASYYFLPPANNQK